MDPSAGYFPWRGGGVCPAAAGFYAENGYVVLTGFSSGDAVAALRAGAADILADPATAPPDGAVFTTEKQLRRMDDAHFLQSAGGVACFREEKAQSGVDREKGTNKIGHAMHDLLPAFAKWSYSEAVGDAVRGLGVARPVVVQSMYILKPPKIGGEVKSHRDGTFVSVKDGKPAVVGLWMALQESHKGNGCLWAVPGSHRDGVSNWMVREDGASMRFVGEEAVEYARDRFVPLEMGPGDLVLLHGAVVHMSLPNESETSRHAYSVHVVDGLESYSEKAWLQRPEDLPFRAFDDPPPGALQ